jgi:hypothetical protein
MTRYRLYKHVPGTRQYLQACYEQQHNGIIFTSLAEDACEYVSIDKAASVARQLQALHGYQVGLEVTEDAR